VEAAIVVATGIARELAAFIWAINREVRGKSIDVT
jgi:hypothetical protein